ncbi:MAG: rod shape-determining protein MreD [Gammaproteobacteria bacterium]|nr:rod shape-determining protein MreD [Gammaproteobacteria bacterium]
MKKPGNRWLVIPATLLLSLFLNVVPYPGWVEFARPDWVTLVLFYWCLATPQWIGVGGGWLMGLLLDLMQYTLFGQHALGKALVAASAHPRLRLCPLWQQCAVVLVISSLDTAIVMWVYHLAHGVEIRLQYWQTAVTTALLWPVAYVLMRRLRQRSGIVRG